MAAYRTSRFHVPMVVCTQADRTPFANTQFLSNSDIRRLCSRRAHEKHKEKIAQMTYEMKRGKFPVSPSVNDGLLYKVTDKDVRMACDSWAYMVKMSAVEGPRLLTALHYDHPSIYNVVGSQKRGLVTGVVCRRLLANQGRRLVNVVMTLLTNIPNETVVVELLWKYFEMLLHMGHDTATLKKHGATFRLHLKQTLGSKWSSRLSLAWSRIIEALIPLWNNFVHTKSANITVQ